MVLGTKGCQRMGSTQTESSVVAPWIQAVWSCRRSMNHLGELGTLMILMEFLGLSWRESRESCSGCQLLPVVTLSHWWQLRPGPGQYEAHPARRQKRNVTCACLCFWFPDIYKPQAELHVKEILWHGDMAKAFIPVAL